MESHGEAGKIHVSEAFAQALFGNAMPLFFSSQRTDHQASVTLKERGVLNIKGKGQLRTYFLSSL